jgi:hypothetical protein
MVNEFGVNEFEVNGFEVNRSGQPAWLDAMMLNRDSDRPVFIEKSHVDHESCCVLTAGRAGNPRRAG